VNILLLSAGGGGGNILRSLKSLFERDVAVTQTVDPQYAARLQSAVTTRFLDTNEFSLADVPADERLLIGRRTTGGVGARHNPEVARQALEESRREVEALIQQHSVIILIGTGGKGTGAGTMFPLAEMARQHRKLVVPIFVRPSFERHEVDKRRYDHAVKVAAQFDAARIRLMEILNDGGYTEKDPQPQAVIWERMNLPIARGLKGLIYVLWDLSQVDPSDLSMLFAGSGRFRIAFAEIDPPAGHDPTDAQIDEAVQRCCDNPYYAFSKPVGTSLICIQGEWSNVVDARIKGRLAAAAMGARANSPYTPLYARGGHAPRPWGVTAVFSEYTGAHAPLELHWSSAEASEPLIVEDAPRPFDVIASRPPSPAAEPILHFAPEAPRREAAAVQPAFSGLWEFAVAVNRSEPAALAVAGNDGVAEMPIEGPEVKKLLGTLWFRSVVPRFSEAWKTRLLDALADSLELPNHRVKTGKHVAALSELSYAELQEVARTSVPDAVKADLDLLLAIGKLWGADALKRVRFADTPQSSDGSKLASLFQGLRHRTGADALRVNER
jgi:cell division GTPase FtsZ